MRISDWSSDVCSSDLTGEQFWLFVFGVNHCSKTHLFSFTRFFGLWCDDSTTSSRAADQKWHAAHKCDGPQHNKHNSTEFGAGDRKSVVSGKSVSVRVDIGGSRLINKKQKRYLQ